MSKFIHVSKAGRNQNIDFSDPLHRELLLSLYGGEEQFKNCLPLQYSAFLEAVNRCNQNVLDGISNTVCSMNQDEYKAEYGFVDGVAVENVSYKIVDNKLIVIACTSLVGETNFIDQHIEIRTAAGEIVYGTSESVYGVQHATMQIETDFVPSQFSSNEIVIDYLATWYDATKLQLCGQMCTKECKDNVVLTDNIASIEMLNPVYQNGKTSGNIVVCYGRVSTGESVDYVYKEDIELGSQWLMLDFGGEVTFNEDNFSAFSHIADGTFLLKMDCQKGMAQYMLEYEKGDIKRTKDQVYSRFFATDEGMVFNLEANWYDIIPTGRLAYQDVMDLNFTVDFYLENGNKSNIQVTSMASVTESSNVKMIPQFILLWGCLEKGSLVAMANGDVKKIEEIKIGDILKINSMGEIAKVSETYCSTSEEKIYTIKTDSGKQIGCSISHPVMTVGGIKPACEITTSDYLVCEDGKTTKVVSVEIDHENTVYNLDLVNISDKPFLHGTTFICNGLLVGDNVCQNSACVKLTSRNIFLSEKENKEALFAKVGNYEHK